MILLSRFLDKKWIEPNAKKFFLKSVGPPTVEYTHLHETMICEDQFRETTHIAIQPQSGTHY